MDDKIEAWKVVGSDGVGDAVYCHEEMARFRAELFGGSVVPLVRFKEGVDLKCKVGLTNDGLPTVTFNKKALLGTKKEHNSYEDCPRCGKQLVGGGENVLKLDGMKCPDAVCGYWFCY